MEVGTVVLGRGLKLMTTQSLKSILSLINVEDKPERKVYRARKSVSSPSPEAMAEHPKQGLKAVSQHRAEALPSLLKV